MKKSLDNSVTIKDIALECGVSISTVSNVINGKKSKVSKEVSDKIHEVVERTGYRPNYLAKSLRALSTKTIGVIAEDLVLFSTSPVIEGLMQCCEEHGYSVVIENMRLFGRWDDEWMHNDVLFQSALTPIISKMEDLNVDGIVYISSYEHIMNFKYESGKIPLVFVYATNDDGKTPSFRLDDEAGGYEVYKYLLEKGHRNIGIITGEAENPHTVNRLRGVQKAMFEAGLLYNPYLIEYQNFKNEGGYEGAKKLYKQDVTAILCLSDLIAAGAYAFFYENDLKPGRDISIVGYDNRDISESLYPPLTTYELPLEQLGYEAITRLLTMLGDDNKEKNVDQDTNIRIMGTLVERDSVVDLINK